jgi:hypothetical protein
LIIVKEEGGITHPINTIKITMQERKERKRNVFIFIALPAI